MNHKSLCCFLLSIGAISFGFTGQTSQTLLEKDPEIITCDTAYALCDTSDCLSNKSGDQAKCKCPIYKGVNFGGTPCNLRQEILKTGQIYSDYAPIHLISSNGLTAASKKLFDPTLMCSTTAVSGYHYADCYNVKCEILGNNNASCICPIKSGQEAMDFAVDASSCAKDEELCQNFSAKDTGIVINSAPSAFGTYIVNYSLKSMGDNIKPSMFCTKPDRQS